MTDDSSDLSISRLLRAPRAAVWRCWSEPPLLVQWWCPRPWTTELHALDLRPGGGFHTTLRGPDGAVSDNPGCVLDIDTGRRVVFTTALTAGWRPAAPWLALTATITLADEGRGTRYVASVQHPDAATCRRHAELGFHDGWNVCIDQLDALASAL